jgi:hypothetical protein
VWLQGKGGRLKLGQVFILFPAKEGGGDDAPAGFLAPFRKALIDDNRGT